MNHQTIGRTGKVCLAHWVHRFLINNFCEEPDVATVATAGRHTSLPLSHKDFRFAYFSAIRQVPFDWDRLASGGDLFLQRPYLTALEDHPPAGMGFGYLIFYRKEQPVGIAVCQTILVRANHTIRPPEAGDEAEIDIVGKLKRNMKSAVKRHLQARLLIGGSLLLTGEHGYYFDPALVSRETGIKLLGEALEYVRESNDPEGNAIRSVMIKDVYADQHSATRSWRREGFNEIAFQPNMVLDLRSDWQSFDDYLNSLSSKYRVRARRAIKKAAPLQRRELTLEEIRHGADRLYALYLQVARGADFNVLYLHPEYLVGLKRGLGDRFRLWGYFQEEEMVGFCTAIHNGKELEAHFLGTDERANAEFQLYLKMLYDLLAEAIADPEAEAIIYARTAMEIKSSVGAVAREMYCYIRHRHSLTNRLLPHFVNYLEPKVQWQARHPFKD